MSSGGGGGHGLTDADIVPVDRCPRRQFKMKGLGVGLHVPSEPFVVTCSCFGRVSCSFLLLVRLQSVSPPFPEIPQRLVEPGPRVLAGANGGGATVVTPFNHCAPAHGSRFLYAEPIGGFLVLHCT